MACGLALKRPHEYDPYLADETFSHEAKRARHTAAHCSPFRPQMGTIAASLPSTSSFAQVVSKDDSPFAAVAGKCQLSESQLDAYLRSEVRNGQRRKLIPRRNFLDVKIEDDDTPRNDYRIPNSPPQSLRPFVFYLYLASYQHFQSGSDSEGESSNIPKDGTNNYQALAEKPQFSLKQVRMICERLLKEQEMRLRYEYEIALNQKLDGTLYFFFVLASDEGVSISKQCILIG
uniref:Akirin n=1 Tax=Angiostrongylus cantonensis TaxID=6313 RepID=A0A0K0D999_ANGCA